MTGRTPMRAARCPAVVSAAVSAAVMAVMLALAAGPSFAQPTAPAVDEPVYLYKLVPGDTLIGIGKRLLADRQRWPELAKANRLQRADRISSGALLRIPLRLMQSEAAPATLASVTGGVRSGVAALQAGQTVDEGTAIQTAADGHVTLRLVDGTLLRLRPSSELRLSESRRVRAANAVRSGARLDKGRVEVEAAPASAGRPGFSIGTPQGVLGVRGTEFRVTVDVALGITRGEVLGGTVAFGPPLGTSAGTSTGTAVQAVSAGFGSVIGGSGAVALPSPLLPALDLRTLPALQERILLRFPLPAAARAVAYRGQVARDAAFDKVVADLSSPSAELRFGDLPDGDYFLRVRAIDAQGFEGRDADLPFRLKARPESPLPTAPATQAVFYGGSVTLTWAANEQAQSYRVQVATEPAFSAPLPIPQNQQALSATLEGLAPGTYYWRLASVRGADDRGPWGEVRSFELRPIPPTPTLKPPDVGDRAIGFSWEGRPGQRFEFQVARDPAFNAPVFERVLQQPQIELPLPLPAPAPGSGRFFVRLRAIDADGFIGPYTAPQYFDIPNCLRDGNGGCVRAADAPLVLVP